MVLPSFPGYKVLAVLQDFSIHRVDPLAGCESSPHAHILCVVPFGLQHLGIYIYICVYIYIYIYLVPQFWHHGLRMRAWGLNTLKGLEENSKECVLLGRGRCGKGMSPRADYIDKQASSLNQFFLPGQTASSSCMPPSFTG